MYEEEKEVALRYGTHASTLKEAYFFHTELSEQMHAVHVAVFCLEVVNALQNLWLSPVVVTPQV